MIQYARLFTTTALALTFSITSIAPSLAGKTPFSFDRYFDTERKEGGLYKKESQKTIAAQKILKNAENVFDGAKDKKNKESVIAGRLCWSGEKYAFQDVSSKDTLMPSHTNIIALAIAVGDDKLVKKFLSAIGDINDIKWDVGGHRQHYNLAHVALDPGLLNLYCVPLVPITTRMDIIYLLGAKGINFNYIPEKDSNFEVDKNTANNFMPRETFCQNPPLAAGVPSNCSIKDYRWLQAAALLWGADASITGSSWEYLDQPEIHPSNSHHITYDYYRSSESTYEKTLDLMLQCLSWCKDCKSKLAQSTIKALKDIEEKRLKSLSKIGLFLEFDKEKVENKQNEKIKELSNEGFYPGENEE